MAEETTPTENAAENAAGGIPAGIDPAFWELGKKQYDTPGSCVTCHQPTGAGLPGAFPPVAESEWVNGPVENLIRIQLRGIAGPIKVKGVDYNSVMPAMAQQTDEQVAAVLTYVRNSFGNSASAVTPEQVAALRTEVGQPMLTVADLVDPASAPAPAEAADGKATETVEPQVIKDPLPKVEGRLALPYPLFSGPFLVIVLLAAGKFIASAKK